MSSPRIRSLQGASPVTIPSLYSRKGSDPKLVALTAYDHPMARVLDESGIDIILVGDSVATVLQGHDTTLPVTLDEMIYHARCVRRGVNRACVVGDLPFLSYQLSPVHAIESAGRFLKEAGVSAVKLEGGEVMAPTVRALTSIDIPVMGHVGMTPQSYHRMGGYRVQGRANRDQVRADAIAIADAGAFAIVLEGLPEDLAREITEIVPCPTIGIGAGRHCDGQILVTHDLLGMSGERVPKFVRTYRRLVDEMRHGIAEFVSDVRSGAFPAEEEIYGSKTGASL